MAKEQGGLGAQDQGKDVEVVSKFVPLGFGVCRGNYWASLSPFVSIDAVLVVVTAAF